MQKCHRARDKIDLISSTMREWYLLYRPYLRKKCIQILSSCRIPWNGPRRSLISSVSLVYTSNTQVQKSELRKERKYVKSHEFFYTNSIWINRIECGDCVPNEFCRELDHLICFRINWKEFFFSSDQSQVRCSGFLQFAIGNVNSQLICSVHQVIDRQCAL